MKVKLYNKAGLAGSKLVIDVTNDVCYDVDACFADKTTSLEWSKVPSDAASIELFESAGCTASSVVIATLGEVGGGGNVSTLKDDTFNNKISAFIVRSTTGANAIVATEDGCPVSDEATASSPEPSSDTPSTPTPATATPSTPTTAPVTPVEPAPAPTTVEPASSSPAPATTAPTAVTPEPTAAPTTIAPTVTPEPTAALATNAPTATAAVVATKGLKLKVYNKADLAGKKLVISTETDVCYSVDVCFEDMTTSLEWTKATSDSKSIDLFESTGCSGSSISISSLGTSGNVTTLKDYKFNNKVSALMVRSSASELAAARNVDACASSGSDSA